MAAAPASADTYVLELTVKCLENGRFLARSKSLTGLNVEGKSIDEVMRLAPRVAKALIAAMKRKGVRLPRSLAAAKAPMSVHLLVSA
jgi:predicted RNase H-like HicB family nuclease